jgi:ABC-type branched-subunit amino acid transport system substrate-binding protein
MLPRTLLAPLLAIGLSGCATPAAAAPGDPAPGARSTPASAPALPELEPARLALVEGKPAEALVHLRPLLGRRPIPPALAPGLHALAALAHHRLGDRTAARAQLDALLASAALRPSERAWAKALSAELAGQPARQPALTTVGVLLPRTGRFRAVARELFAGAACGARAFDPAGAVRLAIMDPGSDAVSAAKRLIDEGARGLVGGLEPTESSRIAALAAERAVPFLAIVCPRAAATTFCVVPTSTERARALAARAVLGLAKGIRVAVLAPESSYGRALAAAFEETVHERGAKVLPRTLYPAATSSFTAQAKVLAAAAPDVVFVPDTARALTLIAPALAGAGLWSSAAAPGPRPGRQARDRRERALRLLATADGLTPSLLAGASRYLEGALLAPGFHPEEAALASTAELRARRVLGRAPTALEAYAHDAVLLLAEAARRSAPGSSSISSAVLRTISVEGLTGVLRFAADGGRADPPRVYQVQGESVRALR